LIERLAKVLLIQPYRCIECRERFWKIGSATCGVFVLTMLGGTCASLLIFWITAHGPGVTPDSTDYIDTAKNLLAGNGFFADGKPLTRYPPTYPLLLAAAGLFQNGDIVQASRWLGPFLFGTNIILVGFAVQMCTERSLAATATAIFFFLSSAPMIAVHSMTWSEPPFITFMLAGLILLSFYVVRPRLHLLLASSLSIGLALTTRYVGLTLLPVLAFSVLLAAHRPILDKIRDIIIATAVASLPVACWLIRNIVTAESLTHRSLAIHPVSLHQVKGLIVTISDLTVPVPISGESKALLLALAAVLFLVALAVSHRKHYANTVGIILPALCLVFFVTYIAFLLVSISFFDAQTPLDARMLLPAWLTLPIAGISLAWSVSRVLDQKSIWYCFVVLVSVSISINSITAIAEAVDIHKNGRGYTSRDWQNSEIVSYIVNVDDSRKIYSNGPDVIRFLAGKETDLIPPKFFPETRRINQKYEEQLDRISKECTEGTVLVAYFNGVSRWFLPSNEELQTSGNLPVLKRFKDGIIYGHNVGAN
jgi:hypothetical protein